MLGDDRRSSGVCGILEKIGVLSDGSYALCGIGESVEDLTFGHSAKDSLRGHLGEYGGLKTNQRGIA